MAFEDPIRNIVQRNTPVVDASDSVLSAIRKMSDTATSAVLVKNDKMLVGIVTDMDLMNCLSHNDALDQIQISTCMTPCELITSEAAKTPCVQLDESENIKIALSIMDEAGVHNLLVSGENDAIIGVVSARDLLKQAIA